MQGGTTFVFVTDGIEAALERPRDVADGRDVLLGGGASAIQQYPAAGLIDGFELHIVPVLLGEGGRLLENVGSLRVEQVRAIEAPGVTHISTASSDRRTCRTEAVSAGSAARGR
jgi:dihydrofolate reductase